MSYSKNKIYNKLKNINETSVIIIDGEYFSCEVEMQKNSSQKITEGKKYKLNIYENSSLLTNLETEVNSKKELSNIVYEEFLSLNKG